VPLPARRAQALHKVLATALALLSAGAPATALALDPDKALSECTVEVWGTRDGLTGATIKSIAQTPDGFLWIGGYGGVARYDGARIVRVEIEPPNDVEALAYGRDGNALVLPRRGDPLCPRGDRLQSCVSEGVHIPQSVRITAAHRDGAGVVWIATEGGLYRFEGGRLALHRPRDELPAGASTAVHHDGRGRLWLGTTQGLFVEAPGGFRTHRGPDGPVTGDVRALAAGAQGRLWAATTTALLRVEGEDSASYPLPRGGPTRLLSQMIEDRDGSVWLGSNEGLMRLREGRFVTYGKRDGLPDEDLTAVFEDREGSLWVGTRNGDLAQFTDRTVSTKAGPPSVRNISIESVSEDAAGVMWFGTNRGLTRWEDGVERTFTTEDGLPENRVYATYPADDGTLWVGTAEGLLRWRGDRPASAVLYPATIFSLYLDRARTLWIGKNDGLGRLRDGRFEEVPNAGGFHSGQVRGIHEDDRGIVWVTTSNGLAQVEGNQLIRARESLGGAALHADRGIFSDRDGSLWFGAGTSLVRRQGGTFRVLGTADGLPRDWLFQVLADDLGFLWAATSRAIFRISKDSIEAVLRGQRHGFALASFDTSDRRGEIAARRSRTPGAWKARDGRLWFATLRGMVTIDPRRVRTNSLPPNVLIERAVVDGRPALAAGENRFPPGAGSLEFQYSGVTLLEPQKASHRYRLEGFDEGWVEAGTRRVAYYTNIPPGAYRFRVQAANADGVWNEAGASISLAIAPHYYQTVWFYALGGCAVLALAFSLYRLRLGHLRARYLAVFAERNRLARELHDSLLQGMSAVALELENVREQLPPAAEAAARRLEVVSNAITDSLEETRRFVWNLREQPSGAGELGLALERLAGRLAEGRPVDCKVQVEGTAVNLSHEAQGSLYRVAQEAIANALKHAEPRRIDVRLAYQARAVRLSVADDGRGFDPEQAVPAGHFGLVGLRERARRLGASLTIDSRPGAGATITVTVPIKAVRSADV
jgi:signal transduction histidine kinase/streptogramin lyase